MCLCVYVRVCVRMHACVKHNTNTHITGYSRLADLETNDYLHVVAEVEGFCDTDGGSGAEVDVDSVSKAAVSRHL